MGNWFLQQVLFCTLLIDDWMAGAAQGLTMLKFLHLWGRLPIIHSQNIYHIFAGGRNRYQRNFNWIGNWSSSEVSFIFEVLFFDHGLTFHFRDLWLLAFLQLPWAKGDSLFPPWSYSSRLTPPLLTTSIEPASIFIWTCIHHFPTRLPLSSVPQSCLSHFLPEAPTPPN